MQFEGFFEMACERAIPSGTLTEEEDQLGAYQAFTPASAPEPGFADHSV